MITLTDLYANFGDVIELNYPTINVNSVKEILKNNPNWVPYNIRKMSNRRLGISVTSLDGGYSGVPDLDSLREFNYLNKTSYTESDFKTRTPIINTLPEIKEILDDWGEDLGRTHFLKLQSGGHFPPHRDNGLALPSPYFRVLLPISGFGVDEMKWIQEDKILRFSEGRAYFVNTTKVHSLFSFVDDCIMLVMNVKSTEKSIKNICFRSKVK